MEATNDEVVEEALDEGEEAEEEEALIKAGVEEALTEELIRLAEDEIKRELEIMKVRQSREATLASHT